MDELTQRMITYNLDVVALLAKLFFEQNPRLRHCPAKDKLLYMPQYAIDILNHETHPFTFPIDEKMMEYYREIQIVTGYDDIIVLSHKMYSTYKDDWMIVKSKRLY